MIEHERDMHRYEQALAEYETRWPGYCKHCGGEGTTSYQENLAPHGSGRRWMYEFIEPCTCTEEGRCPRCGQDWPREEIVETIEEQLPCPYCNWKWGEKEGDVAPYEPEICYLRR